MLTAIGIKRAAMVSAVVVAAALAAIVAAMHMVTVDTVRDAVKREISAVTGLAPVLRGPVTLSIFPAPTLNMSDVVLGDPLAGESAFTVDRLTADLRLLPFLGGRVEIADISLVRPRIAVSVEADGRTNWSPLIEVLARALRPNAHSDDRVLSFSEIRIDDGVIALHNPGSDIDETLKRVDLSLAWPSIAKSFAAAGHFTWHDEIVEASIAIADFPAALAGDNSGLKFRISAAPLKVAFDGAMSYRPSIKIDGTLAADSSSLRDALRWSGERSLPAGGLGRFALKAQAVINGESIALSNLNAELDGNVAEGALTYAATGRQTLQGTLAVGRLDLRPYVSALRLVTDDTRDWDGRAFGLDWLSRWDADLRLSAERVQISRAELGHTAIAATVRAGHLDVTVGESQAFDGVITGTMAVARPESGAEIKSRLQFANVDLEKCLGQLFGLRRLETIGNMMVSIDSTGLNVRDLAGNLNGTVQVTSKQGALNGLNVEQLMRRLQRSPLSGGGDFRGGRTPFDRLKIALRINQGVATVDDAVLESASIRLALSGTTLIQDREFDLSGTAELLGNGSPEASAPFQLPFYVQGPWDSPIILPDTRILIQRSQATGPLLDAVQDKKTRDAARNALERLMGGAGMPGINPH